MKKILIAVVMILIVAFGFYFIKKNNDSNREKNDFKIKIEKPKESKITLSGKYSLNCTSDRYTAINIAGAMIPESSINISKGHEKQVLYVENQKAKYFGAEYIVIQDDTYNLIILRSYELSGLTEVVSISKETGIGLDTNTKILGITGGPTTATYLISCNQLGL